MIIEVDLGAGVGAAFTGRHGGVSGAPYHELNLSAGVGDDAVAVAENRRRIAVRLGLDPARTVWMRQVHGADVVVVKSTGDADGAGPLTVDAADGTVTTEPGLLLAVVVADCAPVLLADPVARVIGVAHSGRPGTAAGVVPAVVERMRAQGAEPARVRAAIGPMVCGECYEVPGPLRDEVAAIVPEAYATTRQGTPGLDLAAGILAQLKAAGVTRVQRDPRCTIETPDLYSYRRDGRTGRFAGLIWLREPERESPPGTRPDTASGFAPGRE